MRTITCILFVNFALLLNNYHPNTIVPDADLHLKCLYPVISVRPVGCDGHGSGVIVKSIEVAKDVWHNVFITCEHVTDGDNPYIVDVFKYEDWSSLDKKLSFPCKFYAVNEKRDLAIGVFVSNERMPTADISFNAKFYIGSEVFRIGCGLGDEPRLDYGKISSLKALSPSAVKNNIRTNVYTVPGDSGSPLFYNYKVIGIMRSIRAFRNQPIFSISYCSPINDLLTWESEINAIGFVWLNKQMPQMPFYRLKIEEFNVLKTK